MRPSPRPRRLRRAGLVAAVLATVAAGVPLAVATGGSDSQGSTDLGDAFVEQARAQRAPEGPGALGPAQPLTGVGENMELVANIPIDFGSDLELHGDFAYVGTYGTCSGAAPAPGTAFPGNCEAGSGGITVIDISNPREPKRVGLFDCAGGQNDVQLSPDGKHAVMAIESRNNACHPGDEGTVVLSLADPANPKEVAFLPILGAPDGSGNPRVGSHNNTLDWPILYIDQYVARYNRIDMFDLSDPANPVKLPGVQYGTPNPSFPNTSPHDLIVDHRPDGRDLLYGASGNQTADVIDVTNPREPVILQRTVDPAVTFSHQAETNHDRKYALVTDEYRGGGEARACGKTPTDDSPRDVPDSATTSDRNNLGALFFYRLNPDGTLKDNGKDVAGTYNLPMQTSDGSPTLVEGAQGCTIHIYWTAPDEDRLVTSWYGKGIRVADFSDPARVRELGWYIPKNANTWSAKPHNGYIFTGDIERGFDVLRYTGEDAKRWPSTAGPAEVQRARIQGAPAPQGATQTRSALAAQAAPTTNANPGPARLASPPEDVFRASLARVRGSGGLRFDRTVRVRRGSTAPVVLTVKRGGTVVSRARFAAGKARGGKLRMRADIAALAGAYTFEVRQGGRRLERGRLLVRRNANARFRLKAGQQFVCRVLA